MGLEVSATIDQLNPAWPLGSDKKREGDDHFRNLKRAILGTFPNLVGPTQVTALMLDELPEAGFSLFLTELLKHVVPVGAILTWSGSIGSIPAGWALCDGTNGTPDLRTRFILGAGTIAVGAIGGDFSVDTGAGGGGETGAHALTIDEIPPHSHDFTALVYPSPALQFGGNVNFQSNMQPRTTGLTGGGSAHTHTLSSHTHTVDTTNPYYALAFIMKTTAFVMPSAP